MEIKCHKTGPNRGFNENWGNNVKTRQWDPLFPVVRGDLGNSVTVPKFI
jgi:hypothetical protein